MQGFSQRYDKADSYLQACNKQLQNYVDEIKLLFPPHKRHLVRLTQQKPMEIEVPDNICFDRPHDFELSSKRAGFFRFTSVQLSLLEA